MIEELSYSLNTFYFLMSGMLVMWMAAGFTMLEAGSIRSKNVNEMKKERKTHTCVPTV